MDQYWMRIINFKALKVLEDYCIRAAINSCITVLITIKNLLPAGTWLYFP